MMARYFIYLQVVVILMEQLSQESAVSCSTECGNNTSQATLCQTSFPLNLSNAMIIVTFCNGRINVENEVLIQNKTSLHLQSYGDGHTELLCNTAEAGFKFIGITDLHISRIDFIRCGATVDTKKLDNSTVLITSGLLILYCTNVKIVNVTVMYSTGSGLLVNQTNGQVQISDSSFDGNCANNTVLAVAGGLYVEFMYNQTSSEVTAEFSIARCTFINNRCTVPSFTDGIGSSTKYQGFGQGGGIRFVLKYNTSNNKISIKNSLFSHNKALWGGGLRVHYLNSPQNNSLIVQNCQFIHNTCFYNGGGIDLGFAAYYTQRQEGTWNKVHLQTCLVRGNTACQYGGGVRIYSSRNKFKAMNMTFSNCFLEDNEALYGPAVDMLPRSVDVYNDGYLSLISFNDCTFTLNRVTRNLIDDTASHSFKHYESGKGVFACADFSLYFSGTTVFSQNDGSAMHLSTCRVHFQSGSHVEFTDNTGYDGGAIVLFGSSVLYVMDNSTFLFINNTAVRRGGAIMYFSSNEHDFISLKSCFIQYLGQNPINERQVQLKFMDNKAMYGQAIFASTLRPCQRLCIHNQEGNWTISNDTSIIQSFGCIGNFHFNENSEKQVSTCGVRLISDFNSSVPLAVIPGQDFHLEFDMTDELSQPSYDTFHVSVESNSSRTLRIDPAYTYVSERKVVKLYGDPREIADIVLTNAEFQPIVISARVEMKHCPPGFVLGGNVNSIKCECSVDTQYQRYYGITRCSTHSKRAYLRNGYWIGYNVTEGEEELITGLCPKGFCQYTNLSSSYLQNEYKLPQNASKSLLNAYVCGHRRTGKLCGSCSLTHSVFFHSTNYQCKLNDHTCRLSMLLYFTSELLPVTFLFLIIIVFDVKFTCGALNSFLFFVQLSYGCNQH